MGKGKAYSQDLRELVVRKVKEGWSQLGVAREFGIGIGTVKRYLSLERETGGVSPRKARKAQPLIKGKDLEALQAQVDAHGDATLEKHIEVWEASHGIRVSRATMCRALKRANRPLKKNATGTPKRRG